MHIKAVSITAKTIACTARALAEGEVVAFPTETVYGLGVDATRESAVQALRVLKEREADKPLQVMCRDIVQAEEYGVFSQVAKQLAQHFLPGPLTLIVQKKEESAIASGVTPGGDTIGIRIPDHSVVQELLHAFGKPIAASSANHAGEAVATSGQEVTTLFGERVAVILDAALPEGAPPSTVVDCTGEAIRILRAGTISKAEILRCSLAMFRR